jgi:hypothetical protein
MQQTNNNNKKKCYIFFIQIQHIITSQKDQEASQKHMKKYLEFLTNLLSIKVCK